jgi:ubiquinone/menaquinone biosynthesis C-methylase UbiE
VVEDLSKVDWLKFYEKENEWQTLQGTGREKRLVKGILERLPIESGKLLEVGPGSGYLLSFLKVRFAVHAFDLSQERLNKVKELVPQAVLESGEAKNLPYENNFFDLTICSEVLEHVPEYEKALKELIRVTKVGGFVLITVPKDEKPVKYQCYHCNKIGFLYGHINFFTLESLGKIAKEFPQTEISLLEPFGYQMPKDLVFSLAQNIMKIRAKMKKENYSFGLQPYLMLILKKTG